MFNNGDLYNPRFRLDWNLYTLYSLAEWINGKAFRKTDYSEKGYPVIKIAELNRGIDENTQYASKDKFDEKFQIKKSDILFAWSGNPKTSINSFRYTYESGWLNQHIFKVIPKESIDKNYLYYLLKYLNPNFEMIASNKQTTGLGHVTKNDLKNIQVRIPKISDQIIISEVLSSFDNKIENNNAIIANLEEQAQTIFKSWFLDSELFQDEEFETKKLGELFEFIKGKKTKTISEVKKEGFVPYLVKKYIDGDEATFTSSDDGILIDDLDIFMLMDGANSGNIYYGYHGILGSTFSFLKNVNEMVNEYIYWYLLINQESVKNQNTGSAIPHANKDYINNLEVALPIDIETNKVLKRLKDIRLYTINIRRENNKLSETRDTLLPKLMSGEIRVEEAIEVEEI